MFARMLVLAGGITGATALSQFPEYSQQYTQRLGGAVEALGQVVADFDTSAAAEGLTREEALSQMSGNSFVERRQIDMKRSFDRYARLNADLEALQKAGPFMRAYHSTRLMDPDIASATWAAYKPAVPVSFVGAVYASSGFVSGGMFVWLVLAFVLRREKRRDIAV